MKKMINRKKIRLKKAFGPLPLIKWVLRSVGLLGVLLAVAAGALGWALGGQQVKRDWNIYDADG